MQSLWKRIWKFLIILKIELQYDLEIAFLGSYLKKMKTLTQKDIGIPMFTTHYLQSQNMETT